MSFIEILKVLVLGIVEGFTEWLPISSTGHLILVDKIVQFKQPEEFVNMFKVVIQLGAILAVLVMYFHRLNPFSKRKKPSQQRATLRLWMKIVVACRRRCSACCWTTGLTPYSWTTPTWCPPC